jgi:hypothetical protein
MEPMTDDERLTYYQSLVDQTQAVEEQFVNPLTASKDQR